MEPPLQRVAALVTGRRYLLLSVLATAVALASTYQRLLLGPLPRAAALALENSTDTVTAETMTMMTPSIADSDSDVVSESVPDSDGMTLAGFTAELMRSRVSAAVRLLSGASSGNLWTWRKTDEPCSRSSCTCTRS